MSRKSRHGRGGAGSPAALLAQRLPRSPDELRQYGLREFRQKRYDRAIEAWELVGQRDDRLTAALAEAHFRLAAQLKAPDDVLFHVKRAAGLVPADAVYAYHLGLTLHRQGNVMAALEQYKRAVANGLTRRSAGVVIALATLELDPKADLVALPGVSDEDRRALVPIVAVLQGQAAPPSDAGGQRDHLDAMNALLSPPSGRELPTRSRFALNVLNAILSGNFIRMEQALPGMEAKTVPPELDAVRWYYLGVAAAARDDIPSAVRLWREALRLHPDMPGSGANLAAVETTRAKALVNAGDRAGAVKVMLEALRLNAGDPALSVMALVELNRMAREAALVGDWAAAADHWANARSVLEQFDPKRAFGKGASARPVLHNLALAHEALEAWQDAAEDWRAMLRTRPRRASVEGYTDAHWMWVRKRVIECYKKAGDLRAAISMFRQALKANPDDVELQLDLVDALRANEQVSSAENELHRLLEKHPDHLDALKTLAEVYLDRGYWYMAQETMRSALALEPDNLDLRKRMAHVLIESGNGANSDRRYDAARDLFTEAAQYAPEDYNIPLCLARVEFNVRHIVLAQEHIERALELGKSEPDAYLQASICWIIEQDLDQARAVIARAEANGHATASVYVAAGMEAVTRSVPPDAGFGMLEFLMGPPDSKPKRPLGKQQEALSRWGHELLSRAVQAGPEVEILRFITAGFVASALSGGAPYARRLTERTPDDLQAWMMLAILLGFERQVKEAQDVFRKTAQLARKHGDVEAARSADELRRVVTDPAFTALVRMGMTAADEELDDFDD